MRTGGGQLKSRRGWKGGAREEGKGAARRLVEQLERDCADILITKLDESKFAICEEHGHFRNQPKGLGWGWVGWSDAGKGSVGIMKFGCGSGGVGWEWEGWDGEG